MAYPQAVLEKAKRLEQLLHQVAAGESLESANEALGFDLDQRDKMEKKHNIRTKLDMISLH